MNIKKLVLTTIASLCLLAAAPVAFAIPFLVTAATQTVGTGYGVDTDEKDGKLLNVQFTNSFSDTQFSAPTFSLDSVGAFETFKIGTVQLDEPNSNSGITAEEIDDLSVYWTFTFASPLSYIQPISILATATLGSVSDDAVDYVLDWSEVLVNFGDFGQFSISLNDLSFNKTDTKNQMATITLVKLPTVSSLAVTQDVPEPASLALMGLALAGLAVSRRRKQALS